MIAMIIAIDIGRKYKSAIDETGVAMGEAVAAGSEAWKAAAAVDG